MLERKAEKRSGESYENFEDVKFDGSKTFQKGLQNLQSFDDLKGRNKEERFDSSLRAADYYRVKGKPHIVGGDSNPR
jgi:hypothetical protein